MRQKRRSKQYRRSERKQKERGGGGGGKKPEEKKKEAECNVLSSSRRESRREEAEEKGNCSKGFGRECELSSWSLSRAHWSGRSAGRGRRWTRPPAPRTARRGSAAAAEHAGALG